MTEREHETIRAEGLTKVFRTRGGPVTAVSDVNFTVRQGRVLGLVGESGSGKSTVARLLLGIERPTKGRVLLDSIDLATVKRSRLRRMRRGAQMVFQNPYGSLLPHYTAAANVAEPLRIHGVGDRAHRRAEALRLLESVGVNRRHADYYPRQFSGGQQQRIAIARALALRPRLLVCDEPTSSLDVSIQAQILTLLQRLHDDFAFACVFISHNLAVIELIADDVMVMRHGVVVEAGPVSTVFAKPQHEYTRRLLQAVLPVRGDVDVPAFNPGFSP